MAIDSVIYTVNTDTTRNPDKHVLEIVLSILFVPMWHNY